MACPFCGSYIDGRHAKHCIREDSAPSQPNGNRCGDCTHWQVIDSSQLADGTPPENHVGRCRGTAEVPGWARARRRSSLPYNQTCFESNGHQAQAYGEHARRGG